MHETSYILHVTGDKRSSVLYHTSLFAVFSIELGILYPCSAKLGLVTAVLASSFPGIISGLIIGPINGLALGLFGVVFFGLRGGLQAVLRHYILRFYLWRTHQFPWNATRFLDDATSRMLLQRVGGSYSFVHRLLLDYFEDLYRSQRSK